MKSPADLAHQQGRQWANNGIRVRRMLDDSEWPLVLSVTKPSADAVAHRGAEVRAHLDRWRAISVGEVGWEAVNYRATGVPIDIPVLWTLSDASEWIEAIGQPEIGAEFAVLKQVLKIADPRYHELLVRRRSLVVRRDFNDVEAALRIADLVTPGCAEGVPLRALALGGVDTKFYERNRALMLALLDERFEGVASERGLEPFLGAAGPDGHWLLRVALDGSPLPYRRSRVTDTELGDRGDPGSRLLVVENEKCVHALPAAADTIAVLGAGLNLGWLGTTRLVDHRVAYWGDLDTWGFRMLAAARVQCPHLTPLLMDEQTFDAAQERAVVEPERGERPGELSEAEQALFTRLAASERGRLEQEFIPRDLVTQAVDAWLNHEPQERIHGRGIGAAVTP